MFYVTLFRCADNKDTILIKIYAWNKQDLFSHFTTLYKIFLRILIIWVFQILMFFVFWNIKILGEMKYLKSAVCKALIFTQYFDFRRGRKWWECTVKRRSRRYPNHWETKYKIKRRSKERRRGDSNPRYDFSYSSFRDCRLKPTRPPLHLNDKIKNKNKRLLVFYYIF